LSSQRCTHRMAGSQYLRNTHPRYSGVLMSCVGRCNIFNRKRPVHIKQICADTDYIDDKGDSVLAIAIHILAKKGRAMAITNSTYSPNVLSGTSNMVSKFQGQYMATTGQQTHQGSSLVSPCRAPSKPQVEEGQRGVASQSSTSSLSIFNLHTLHSIRLHISLLVSPIQNTYTLDDHRPV
jgi:hypothetical protein